MRAYIPPNKNYGQVQIEVKEDSGGLMLENWKDLRPELACSRILKLEHTSLLCLRTHLQSSYYWLLIFHEGL